MASGNSSPKVSVVMPAHNAAGTIAASINSVVEQSYANWELLVVDDASKDNTAEIVSRLGANDDRIVLLHMEVNGGVSRARNMAVDRATGDFIAFLDSDDLWLPEKLERQVGFHVANPNINISHTDFHFFDNKGIVKRRLKYLLEPAMSKRGFLYPQICYRNCVGILTVMVNTTLLRNYGGFDSHLRGTEDHYMWIRIAKDKNEFGFIDTVYALYRTTGSGLSRNLSKYKVALKRLNSRILTDTSIEANRLMSQYYRYVGTLYYHKNNYLLSRLYLGKSVALAPTGLMMVSTLAYMMLAWFKSVVTKN